MGERVTSWVVVSNIISIFFIFTPILGEMMQFDYDIFATGLKPPTSHILDWSMIIQWMMFGWLVVKIRRGLRPYQEVVDMLFESPVIYKYDITHSVIAREISTRKKTLRTFQHNTPPKFHNIAPNIAMMVGSDDPASGFGGTFQGFFAAKLREGTCARV